MEATATEVKNQNSREETPLEAFASVCTVLVLGLFVLTFLFQNFEIPSSSMEKTLLVGDHVVVDRVTLSPPASWAPFLYYRNIHRGDIIVFWKPGEPNLFLVKRVIGIPGDHIHLRNGIVYLNGQAQHLPQAQQPNYGDYMPYRDDFPAIPPSESMDVTSEWALDLPSHIQGQDLVVPEGEYFAMGDNRPVSLDSRYWGFVPRAHILGRPLFVYWSFVESEQQYEKTTVADHLKFYLHVLTHFPTQTRWGRTFHLIR